MEHHALTNPGFGQIVSSTVNIGNVLPGYVVGTDFLNELTSHLYVKHQFAGLDGIPGALFSLATFGASSVVLETAGLATTIVGAVSDVTDVVGGRGVRNDFAEVRDAQMLANFHEDFDISGVIISEIGQPPQLLGWPTLNTIGSIQALSHTFTNNQDNLEPLILYDGNTNSARNNAERMAIANQGGFSKEEILGVEGRALELFSILNSHGDRYFSNYRDPIWDAIENRDAYNSTPNTTIPDTSYRTINVGENIITPQR